jgi:hypothetical protein
MASFLDNLDSVVVDAAGNTIDFLKDSTTPNNNFNQDGFMVPTSPTSDGNGLPSSKVPSNRIATPKRSLIHWFIPEFGVVKMYVNPSEVIYNKKKQINKERTKGGYSLQYWGEELETISIRGNTGSSGIEGMNVLEEIYRAEQFSFDSIGLTLASDNAAQGLASNFVSKITDKVANKVGVNVLGGILGPELGNTALAARNIPSLAQFAFSVEMFYQGWVYRGFFESLQITESISNLGLFEYSINFTATQRRGYRTNYMPWHKSAIDGPSNNIDPSPIPKSFLKLDR